VVWLVADFEATIYQGALNLIRGKSLKPALRRQLTIPRVSNRPFLYFGYPLSNINHLINPQNYLSTLSSKQGVLNLKVWTSMKEVFFNPCKVHWAFLAGRKKDKLFCNFWFAGGLCANCKCAWPCAKACSKLSVCLLYLSVDFSIIAVRYL